VSVVSDSSAPNDSNNSGFHNLLPAFFVLDKNAKIA
jgi:hypothetical protein